MSDLRNADGSPIASEAQADVLSPDSDRKSTHGGNFDQNTLSFCRGNEVNLGSTAARIAPGRTGDGSPTPDSCTSSGFGGLTAVPVSVKPVDRRTLAGSTPGDFRAKASPAVLPNMPAPRTAVGQAPLSGKQSPTAAPSSFDSENLGS